MTWGNLAKAVSDYDSFSSTPNSYITKNPKEHRAKYKQTIDPIIWKVMDEIKEIQAHHKTMNGLGRLREIAPKWGMHPRTLHDGVLHRFNTGKWRQWPAELIEEVLPVYEYMYRRITYNEIASWYGITRYVVRSMVRGDTVRAYSREAIIRNYREKGSVYNLLPLRATPPGDNETTNFKVVRRSAG